ncbi:hypothetical protein [Mucilaginibacter sp.]|jgi:hypothetical protein|uniref:hypothetical protein n=1 Tax=Mucilaginibacter sp. TaxID=1882438 RepID=UPI003568229B
MAQTTISIHDGVRKAAATYAKQSGIKGGLSGYIETLLKEDLKQKGRDWDDLIKKS